MEYVIVYCMMYTSWSCFRFSVVFFFFKQKTADEVRISDWSSDVCSSDLARHAEAGRLIALARSMLNADRDSLAVTYLDLAVSAISSSNAVTAVNRRANGTPYRRAKGTPLRDGAGLIGHAPLRCARRREGGARPEARAAQSIF